MNAVLIGVLVVGAAVSGQDYCSESPEHPLCKNSEPKCWLSGGVSDTDKETILSTHNAFRQRVASGSETRGLPGSQPQAANMRLMVWDDELAKLAQRWSERCTYDHDESLKKIKVGQNLFIASGNFDENSSNWTECVTDWYNEVDMFNPSIISSYKSSTKYGHYTQVVWADSIKVGCGHTLFKDAAKPEIINKFYVCNYGPIGNFPKQVIYKKGAPCSKCPVGTSCRTSQYPALCS